jgi:hypothetical protein
MYTITRSDDEVDDLLNRAAEEFDRTTDAGAEMVSRVVSWLTGSSNEDPLS